MTYLRLFSTEYRCDCVGTMRPKARELAQHSGPPVTQQGAILYVMDSPCRLPPDGLYTTCPSLGWG
jgi:hypothetical protein